MAKLLKLPCGLSVCYERRRGTGSCALGIYVAAGSRDEDDDSNGVAHFIEHMLWKGTERRTAADIADEFDALGANSNAYTSKSNTCFYAFGLAKYLPKYMDIFSDMLFYSTFTEENIEKERGVVLEEIKMYDDEGDSVCEDLLAAKYYGKSKLARPILGTEETVKSLTAEKIRRFMAKYYVPQNIALSYAGPATEEEILALAETYFGKEFSSRTYAPAERKKEKVRTKRFFATRFDKPFEQANVIIRFPAYPVESAKENAAAVAAGIIGGGMSSRLFQKVREESGLVYEIYASETAVKGTGYVTIAYACMPECAKEAMLKVREVLEEAKKNGFTQEEFDKIKASRETNVVLGEEAAYTVMRLMGKSFCMLGKPTTFRASLKKLEKITLTDVTEAFRCIFDYDKAAVAYVGKKTDVDLLAVLKHGGDYGKN